jgi:quinol monooxygenase YgiN
MSELLGIARLKIHPGKLDEFKHLAARCVELVRTKDTGTLQYQLYFNSANGERLAFKRYGDSQDRPPQSDAPRRGCFSRAVCGVGGRLCPR